jgi:hypothetical protein
MGKHSRKIAESFAEIEDALRGSDWASFPIELLEIYYRISQLYQEILGMLDGEVNQAIAYFSGSIPDHLARHQSNVAARISDVESARQLIEDRLCGKLTKF